MLHTPLVWVCRSIPGTYEDDPHHQNEDTYIPMQGDDAYNIPSDVSDPISEKGFLAAVLDGMSSGGLGRAAAQAARTAITTKWFQLSTEDVQHSPIIAMYELMRAAQDAARQVVKNQVGGTTCLIVLIQGDLLTFGHVGDCQLFVTEPDKTLKQLTVDHSALFKTNAGRALHDRVQQLAIEQLTPEEITTFGVYENRLTRFLGRAELPVDPARWVDIGQRQIRRGDVLMLCSDGVLKQVALAGERWMLARVTEEAADRFARTLQRGPLQDRDDATFCLIGVRRTPQPIAADGLDEYKTLIVPEVGEEPQIQASSQNGGMARRTDPLPETHAAVAADSVKPAAVPVAQASAASAATTQRMETVPSLKPQAASKAVAGSSIAIHPEREKRPPSRVQGIWKVGAPILLLLILLGVGVVFGLPLLRPPNGTLPPSAVALAPIRTKTPTGAGVTSTVTPSAEVLQALPTVNITEVAVSAPPTPEPPTPTPEPPTPTPEPPTPTPTTETLIPSATPSLTSGAVTITPGTTLTTIAVSEPPVYTTFTYPGLDCQSGGCGFGTELLQRIFGEQTTIAQYTSNYDRLNGKSSCSSQGVWGCLKNGQEIPGLIPWTAWTAFTGEVIEVSPDRKWLKVQVGIDTYYLNNLDRFATAAAVSKDARITIVGTFERPTWSDLTSWDQRSQSDGLAVVDPKAIRAYPLTSQASSWEIQVPDDLKAQPVWLYSNDPVLLSRLVPSSDAEFQKRLSAGPVLIYGAWDSQSPSAPVLNGSAVFSYQQQENRYVCSYGTVPVARCP